MRSGRPSARSMCRSRGFSPGASARPSWRAMSSRHLDTALADKPATFRPLVYCWRGGQRSNAMATILAQVGWRTTVLQGGYRTYRRWAQQRLYEGGLGLQLVLLDGGTGCGKTEILNRAAATGRAGDRSRSAGPARGSLFGALEGQPQPAQKWFESCLLRQLDGMDPGAPGAGRGRIQQGRQPHAAAGALAGDAGRAADRTCRRRCRCARTIWSAPIPRSSRTGPFLKPPCRGFRSIRAGSG